MTEPDFEQIARLLKHTLDDHPQLAEQNHRIIVQALRRVWNARGAARPGPGVRDAAERSAWLRGARVSNIDISMAIKALDR